MGRIGAATLAVVATAVAGCGSTHRKTIVCNVSPGSNGGLVYSPAGCQNHLKRETLNIIATQPTDTMPTTGEGAFCIPPGGGQGMIVVEGSNGPDPGYPNCVSLDGP